MSLRQTVLGELRFHILLRANWRGFPTSQNSNSSRRGFLRIDFESSAMRLL